MTKKTKTLYLITLIILLFVVTFTFYKIFILHNYLVSYEVPCDPQIESCFVIECDQETEEDCNIDNSEKYYKLVEKKAFNVIKCPAEDATCLFCQKDEPGCTTTLCDSSIEGDICSSL